VPNPLTAGLLVLDGGVGIFSPYLEDSSSAVVKLFEKVGLVKFKVVTGLVIEDGIEMAACCCAALIAASIWAAARAATGLLNCSCAARAMAPRELWNWFIIIAGCCAWLMARLGALVMKGLTDGLDILELFAKLAEETLLLAKVLGDLGFGDWDPIADVTGDFLPEFLALSTVLTVTVVPAGILLAKLSALFTFSVKLALLVAIKLFL